jgi:hypothetical protein
MDIVEMRDTAERYRRLAGECAGSELARLLLACAEGYEEEVAAAQRRVRPARTPFPA